MTPADFVVWPLHPAARQALDVVAHVPIPQAWEDPPRPDPLDAVPCRSLSYSTVADILSCIGDMLFPRPLTSVIEEELRDATLYYSAVETSKPVQKRL